jgi:predicted acetyltransferase
MLLGYGIKRAKELELDKIIITCYEDNKYSKRLIEGAGGILVNSFFLKSMDKFLLRYLLQLSK